MSTRQDALDASCTILLERGWRPDENISYWFRHPRKPLYVEVYRHTLSRVLLKYRTGAPDTAEVYVERLPKVLAAIERHHDALVVERRKLARALKRGAE